MVGRKHKPVYIASGRDRRLKVLPSVTGGQIIVQGANRGVRYDPKRGEGVACCFWEDLGAVSLSKTTREKLILALLSGDVLP